MSRERKRNWCSHCGFHNCEHQPGPKKMKLEAAYKGDMKRGRLVFAKAPLMRYYPGIIVNRDEVQFTEDIPEESRLILFFNEGSGYILVVPTKNIICFSEYLSKIKKEKSDPFFGFVPGTNLFKRVLKAICELRKIDPINCNPDPNALFKWAKSKVSNETLKISVKTILPDRISTLSQNFCRELEIPTIIDNDAEGIIVISFYDGVGTGLFCLQEEKIPVAKYYAIESDFTAKLVAKTRFSHQRNKRGEPIYENLDNIFHPTVLETLMSLNKVHLILGASPCNNLSGANANRQGLKDSDSGETFYKMIKITEKLLEKFSNSANFKMPYFFLENVSSMTNVDKDLMTTAIGIDYIKVKSEDHTAMPRKRLYWTNIPYNVQDYQNPRPLIDFLLWMRSTTLTRLPYCVTTNKTNLCTGEGKLVVDEIDGDKDYPSIEEIERVFGFPSGYTSEKSHQTDYNKRRRLLGKAWCATTVRIFFKNLPFYKVSRPIRDLKLPAFAFDPLPPKSIIQVRVNYNK